VILDRRTSRFTSLVAVETSDTLDGMLSLEVDANRNAPSRATQKLQNLVYSMSHTVFVTGTFNKERIVRLSSQCTKTICFTVVHCMFSRRKRIKIENLFFNPNPNFSDICLASHVLKTTLPKTLHILNIVYVDFRNLCLKN
jgi:hypothetical protein